jgi:hypothetical protein
LSIGGEDLSEAFLDRASRLRPKPRGGAPTVEWGDCDSKKLVDADFAKLHWVRGATRYVRQNEMLNGSTMALKQFLLSIIFFVAGWLVLGAVLLCGRQAHADGDAAAGKTVFVAHIAEECCLINVRQP